MFFCGAREVDRVRSDKWINKIYKNMLHVQDINGPEEAIISQGRWRVGPVASWIMATLEAIAPPAAAIKGCEWGTHSS